MISISILSPFVIAASFIAIYVRKKDNKGMSGTSLAACIRSAACSINVWIY